MPGLYFFIPALVVIIMSVVAVIVGGVALRMTGLDGRRATFQAVSAFTGTGFTTKEAESVVEDDRRRRIVMVLMVLGNAGLVSVLATLVGGFVKLKAENVPIHLAIFLGGIAIVLIVVSRRGLMRRFNDWIERRLARTSMFEQRPMEEVLRLGQGYGVADVRVLAESPLAGKVLAEAGLTKQNILVLAIARARQILPSPKAEDKILPGDRLICYGLLKSIRAVSVLIDERASEQSQTTPG